MDVLSENYDSYLEHLFTNTTTVVTRDTSVCYFDCTDYYFETETEDADYIDEVTGEIFKGFRKYCSSKQQQPNPLVQMGLMYIQLFQNRRRKKHPYILVFLLFLRLQVLKTGLYMISFLFSNN